MIELKKDMKILFIGDSITDSARADVTEFLGIGYPRLVTGCIRGKFPELNLETVNRAISGNRTCDLKERWDWDCIHVKPDVCCILIGINDTLRRFEFNEPTSCEEFENNYREILQKNKDNNIKTIIIEPFVMFAQPEKKIWYEEEIARNQEIVKKLAEEFDCEFIPMHNIFQKACENKPVIYWSYDGVHPFLPGHYLIAREILKVFGVKEL